MTFRRDHHNLDKATKILSNQSLRLKKITTPSQLLFTNSGIQKWNARSLLVLKLTMLLNFGKSRKTWLTLQGRTTFWRMRASMMAWKQTFSLPQLPFSSLFSNFSPLERHTPVIPTTKSLQWRVPSTFGRSTNRYPPQPSLKTCLRRWVHTRPPHDSQSVKFWLTNSSKILWMKTQNTQIKLTNHFIRSF